jgi:predicted MFS family arabinose efflux permease
MLSGTGLSTFIAPLVSAVAFEHFGWRAPFFVFAAASALIVGPILLGLMRLRPRDFGPQGKDGGDGLGGGGAHMRAALRDPRVWQFVTATLLLGAGVGLIWLHMQAILRDAGATLIGAATYFTIVGPTLVFGRLIAGALLDRLPTRLVATAMLLMPALTCMLLLTYDGSAFWGFAACAAFGLSLGAETDLLAFLTARYFGTVRYPAVYSLVFSVFGLSNGLAAVLGGATYDYFGSYAPILWVLFAGVIMGMLLVVALGPPPRSPEENAR